MAGGTQDGVDPGVEGLTLTMAECDLIQDDMKVEYKYSPLKME